MRTYWKNLKAFTVDPVPAKRFFRSSTETEGLFKKQNKTTSTCKRAQRSVILSNSQISNIIKFPVLASKLNLSIKYHLHQRKPSQRFSPQILALTLRFSTVVCYKNNSDTIYCFSSTFSPVSVKIRLHKN